MTIFINEEQVQEILDVKSTVDILEESMKSLWKSPEICEILKEIHEILKEIN